jgi:hypothetical protein
MKAHILNALAQNEASLSGSSPSSGAVPYIANVSPRAGNPYTWPAITKMYNRGSNGSAGGFTSSAYWTSWYAYGNSTNGLIQTCGMAFPNLRQNTCSSGEHMSGGPHRAIYSKGGLLGVKGAKSVSNNNTSYAPFSQILVFIKNVTGSAINHTIESRYTSYYSSGQDGSGAVLVTPNSATKSTTTAVSISTPFTYSGNSTGSTTSYSIAIPANTTVALIQTCSYYYWTTFSSGGHWQNQNVIRTNNLPAGLEPDHDMHASALMANNYTEYNDNGATSTAQIASQWATCARVFGD